MHENRSPSPIFTRQTDFSYEAGGEFYLRFELYGTIADIDISTRYSRGAAAIGVQFNDEIHSPSNPACSVRVRFDVALVPPAEVELDQANLDPPTEVFEAPVSN
jgi:hypothetical protein